MFFFLLFFCITYLSVSIICTLYEIVVDKNINLLFIYIYTVPYNVDVSTNIIMCGENVIITRFTIELLLFQHPELVVLARANVFFNGGRGIPVYNINSRYKATNP